MDMILIYCIHKSNVANIIVLQISFLFFILFGKSEGKRPRERPKRRWEDGNEPSSSIKGVEFLE
jgi:hypothetical protein